MRAGRPRTLRVPADKKTKFFELYRQLGGFLQELDALLEGVEGELEKESAGPDPKPERMKLLTGQKFMLQEASKNLEEVFLVWTDYGQIFEISELSSSEKWIKN